MNAGNTLPGWNRARAPADPRRQYLDEVIAELWPGRRVSTERGAVGESYALVPNGRRPVAMVPRRPRRVAAGVLRNYKVSADRGTQLRLQLYGLGARLGVADLLPDRVTITPNLPSLTDPAPATNIGEHLRLVLERDVVLAVYTSPPRANRKTVLQLLTPRGETFAFAKIGTNDLTRSLVRREADALRRLSESPLTLVRVPRLLHHGQWRGFEVLVQQAFAHSVKTDMSPHALAASMVEVAALGGSRPCSVGGSPYVENLRARLDSLPRQPYGLALSTMLQQVLDRGEGTPIRLGSWHGDWTPWNMTTDGSSALVWDWERFEGGVPRGFDALHHYMQGSIVRDDTEPTVAARAMLGRAVALLAPFGVPGGAADVTARLYLVELGARYAQDRQAEAGSELGRLETWLLPALRDAMPARES